MKNIYFRIFLILALPFLFLAMGADTGGLSGSGSCVSSNRSSSDIGEGANPEFIMDLTKVPGWRALFTGTVPPYATYTEGELRAIPAVGGDYENPVATEKFTGLAPDVEVSKTIRGLWLNTSYKAKFFYLDGDSYKEGSNEVPFETSLNIITTRTFGHSMGYFLNMMESEDGSQVNFLGSWGLDQTQPDQVGIFVIDKTIHPTAQEEILTINPPSDPANDWYHAFMADTSKDGVFTFVCDPHWGKPFSYKNAGRCDIFINKLHTSLGVFTQSLSIESAEMAVFNPSFVEQQLIGGSHSYDPATKSFLVSGTEVSCGAGPKCGIIAQFTLDADNQTATFVKFVQGGNSNAQLGIHVMGDFNGDGAADIAFISDVDRFKNDSRCPEVKYCLDSFDCNGSILAKFSQPMCAASQGVATFLPVSWSDFNGDGYDDVAFIAMSFDPGLKTYLNIFWGSPTGPDPENVFMLGGNNEPSDGWVPAVGDMDADGDDDLVIFGLTNAYVYLNQDVDIEPIQIDVPDGLAAVVTDIDLDGYADIIRTNLISGSLEFLSQIDPNSEYVYFIAAW